MTSKTILAAAAAVIVSGSLLLPIVAEAATSGAAHEQVSVRVGYADLDLSSPGDVSRLEQRVGTAIRRLCSSHGARSVAGLRERTACRAEATAQAGEQVRVALATWNERARRA